MSASVTVTKLNWRGETVYSWGGEEVARGPGYVTLRAVWKGPGTVRVAEDVVFEHGDIFYEHYYDGKPYGLWQVLTPDERTLKCWYCNISTPAHVSDDTITFRDLLLDVLLLPDGTCRVLDCDELARARAEGLDPALAALAEEGAREVLDLIATGRPPFGGESMPSGKRPTPG
jgi:predicted RNA-binding protein associated with RNAse of E/G family